MGYRTILVPAERPETARSAIEAAFLVARRFAGHVRGLHVLPDLEPPATHALVATRMTAREASGDYQRFMATAVQEVRRQADELRRLFDEAAARAGAAALDAPTTGAPDRPSASWEEAAGFEAKLVGQLGRLFDLTVVARPGPGGSAHDTVQAALFDTGRPLLLVPPEPPASVGERTALLAWNASPQAARAASVALPFLRRAARVVVISVGKGSPPDPSAEQMARSLAWHGVVAEARHLEQGDRRVRDMLLTEAAAAGADLLVIGAYSHSRMRQVVLGGVTEHLLDNAGLPVLMTL